MNGTDFAHALRALETLEVAAHAPERHLRLAGATLRVRYAAPRLADVAARALAHHEVVDAPATRPDLEVVVVDRDTPGNPLRSLPATANSVAAGSGDRVERWSYDGAAGRALLHEGFRVLYLWDRALGRAAVCFDDASALPYYQVALPLLPILGWFFAERGCAIVHAAAVETGTGAILLGGRSGTGKSTAALACLDAGLGYLGDDLCLVEAGALPRVHSLYCSAKLDPGDTPRFPGLAPALLPPTGVDWSKSVYLFDCHRRDGVVHSSPLLGVAIPHRGTPGSPVALSAGLAFLAIAPNTVFLLPGAARAAAAGVRALVTRVPVHRVAVGSAVADIPAHLGAYARGIEPRAGRDASAA